MLKKITFIVVIIAILAALAATIEAKGSGYRSWSWQCSGRGISCVDEDCGEEDGCTSAKAMGKECMAICDGQEILIDCSTHTDFRYNPEITEPDPESVCIKSVCEDPPC